MPTSPDGILQAEFDTAWASVTLIVDGGMWPSPVTAVTIRRAVAGVEAVTVRGVDRLPLVGGYFIGTDSEAPLGASVQYVADGYASTGELVASATISVATSGAAAGVWLKVAGSPNLTAHAAIRAIGDIESTTQGGVYQIAGGGAVGVSEFGGINAENFSLTLSANVGGQLEQLRGALYTSRTVLVQPVGSTDIDPGWYFVHRVTRSNPAQVEHSRFRWYTLDLTRTGVPSGAGQGLSDWSWAAVLETYSTWEALGAAHPSWFSLLRGA